ncbi:MAG: TspO/MBR family protein [Candidatus Gottesmanbacteria bacterium]
MPPVETWRVWYDALIKPSWTPPGGTIGIIWSILYPMIAVSFVYVMVNAFKGKLSWTIGVIFIINLIANLLFSPIFFGLKNIPLATLDILIVWVTIVAQFFLMWPQARGIALLQIPYFLWVSTASIIQLTVFFSNR